VRFYRWLDRPLASLEDRLFVGASPHREVAGI